MLYIINRVNRIVIVVTISGDYSEDVELHILLKEHERVLRLKGGDWSFYE